MPDTDRQQALDWLMEASSQPADDGRSLVAAVIGLGYATLSREPGNVSPFDSSTAYYRAHWLGARHRSEHILTRYSTVREVAHALGLNADGAQRDYEPAQLMKSYRDGYDGAKNGGS